MQIRNITQNDQAALIDMYQQFHKTQELDQKPVEFPTPFYRSEIQGLLFIAESGTAPNGFIWGNHIAYGPSKYGMVEELFVKPESRNRGIGSALLTELFQHFKELGSKVVFISVEEKNQQAIHFYESRGFTLCTGRFYYRIP